MPAVLFLLSFLRRKADGFVSGRGDGGKCFPSRAAGPDAWRIELGGRPLHSPTGLIVLYNSKRRNGQAKCCTQQAASDTGHRAKQAGGLLGCSGRTARESGQEAKQKPPRLFSVEKTGRRYIIYYKVRECPPPVKARSGHLNVNG